ncbi:sugar phosphate isomerase/epimerase [Sporolactobacillus sp. THM7-7]|nr:sugar phosphate isomerase/epimerase [Sporolactobacillus sp. THM7-7]
MKLFLSSTLCWSDPVDKVIQIADRYGFAGVEIWAEQVWHHQTEPEEILRANDPIHLELTFHAASWDLNLCALNEGIRNQSVTEIEKSMRLASRIGAENVTIHPGRVTLPAFRDWHHSIMVDRLTYLAGRAEELHVTISVEMMEHIKKELIVTPYMMNRLLNDLPETIRTTFDMAHVPLDQHVIDYFRHTERINKIHMSDAKLGQYHVPLGQGVLPIQKILSQLRTTRLPVILEGLDTDPAHPALLANCRYLQTMQSCIEEGQK